MIFLLCATLLITQTNETLLPKWMTPEESLRVHEIGRGHKITAPPGGWVETPAEFEQLRGVFVTWIYGSYNSIFREIVREAGEVSKVYIIVGSTSEQSNITSYLQTSGIPLDSVVFYVWPRNSVWVRDYGPWFMRKHDNSEGIVDFIYNRPRPLDDTIPWRIGQSWGISVYGSPLEHAGGNFMVDGLGTGFASTLIHEENPQFSAAQIESLMLAYSGLEQFIVLPRINIEYTGHIDLWTKILNDTLVMVGEYAPGHPNYTTLNENADSISRCKNREGFPYRIVRIPMPWSTSSAPPSYLNSFMVNNKVLVPIYNLTEDSAALDIYQQALPDYEIIGIDCSAMSGSGGAIHCITMQALSAQYIHVQHYPMTNTADTLNAYRIRTRIATSSNLISDSTLISYKINSGSYNTVMLAPVVDTPGVYAGYVPAQSLGDTVYYYISTLNSEGVRRTSPRYVPPQVYSFLIGFDLTPPQIVHTPLGNQSINSWPVYASAVVTDESGIDSVILEYSLNGMTQTPIWMPNISGNTYGVTFSGTVNIGDTVAYRIKAVDASPNHNISYSPASGYHQFAIIERIPIGIWEPDPTPITSGPLIAYLDSVGVTYEHSTTFPDFDAYECMFIFLGVYSSNYQLATAQANALVSYLQSGANCYMEGADAWCYDSAGSIYRSYFGIAEVGDGGTISGPIDGITGTFTQGMSFVYAGENNYIDRISPISPAYEVFTNGGFNRTVAYDATTYKTIGSSFELGGLVDGVLPSTTDYLIERILTFLGIITGVQEYKEPVARHSRITASPNPARDHFRLSTILHGETHLRIEFYNVLGQRVRCLIDRLLDAGEHELTWNFRDEKNRELAPGTYFYRVMIGDEIFTGKILRIE
ncbi:MAG: agmatine deiminase family protein [bacterium]